MTHHVAIIGSGPSGFYAAEALAKSGTPIAIDIFERLPTPYGLVRSGVAPDHQGTKNVWRVYQRTARRPEVRFVGNVEIGRDLSLDELRAHYDAVVLANGAPLDRALGVDGEDLRGVIGSQLITGWYNGHPDFSSYVPPIEGARAVAIIGNGNVAVDVARVLARRAHEMKKTDLPDYASTHIETAALTDIYMIGRRGPLEASFTPVELRELGDLAETVALVDPADLPEYAHAQDPAQQKLKEKILDTLREYSKNDPQSKPCRLHIMFYGAPAEIRGDDRVGALVLDRTRVENGKAVMTGEQRVLEVGAVVKAIGYLAKPLEGVAIRPGATCYPNEHGRVDEGLYAVGWAKRGPSGVIATNRQDSIDVIERLVGALPATPKPGPRESVDALLRERGCRATTFTDWEKIEKVEAERARPEAPRSKVTSWDELLAIASS